MHAWPCKPTWLLVPEDSALDSAADGVGVAGVQQRQVMSAEVGLLSNILDKVAPYKVETTTCHQSTDLFLQRLRACIPGMPHVGQ